MGAEAGHAACERYLMAAPTFDGRRLGALGSRIRLDGDLSGTPFKDWTLGGMMRPDRRGSAMPWARLIARGRAGTAWLDAAPSHRAGAALVLPVTIPVPPAPACLALPGRAAALVAIDLTIFRFVKRRCSPCPARQAVDLNAILLGAALPGLTPVRIVDQPARLRVAGARRP